MGRPQGSKNKNKKHEFYRTRFYKIWESIKYRCNNPNHKRYKDYGGRGITCDCWDEFISFKEDMYESYLEHIEGFGEKQTTIDRINNDLSYSKENCKWSTYKEQRNNQRDCITQKYFTAVRLIDGYIEISNNQSAFARKYSLNQGNINSCLKDKQKTQKGWTFKCI